MSSDCFINQNINIKNNGRLVIYNDMHCQPGVTITIESGGNLIIHGGKLINPMLYFFTGGNLEIDNNGELTPLNEIGFGCFELPVGATMNIYQGVIKASDINI